MGIQGHATTATQCMTPPATKGSEAFSWNWTRGTTTPQCAGPPNSCPYALCYYQFSCNGYHTNQSTNFDEVQSYSIETHASVSWEITKPSSAPVYHSRVIYDFFLLSELPTPQKPWGEVVTDEIVIMLNYQNGEFMLPCKNNMTTPAHPLSKAVVQIGDDIYDFLGTGNDGPAPNVHCQIAQFSRRGGLNPTGGSLPKITDLKPFVDFARKQPRLHYYSGGEMRQQKPSGSHTATVGLINEIYDNTDGTVSFSNFPKINAVKNIIV